MYSKYYDIITIILQYQYIMLLRLIATLFNVGKLIVSNSCATFRTQLTKAFVAENLAMSC